jgi:hypothetical protein
VSCALELQLESHNAVIQSVLFIFTVDKLRAAKHVTPLDIN